MRTRRFDASVALSASVVLTVVASACANGGDAPGTFDDAGTARHEAGTDSAAASDGAQDATQPETGLGADTGADGSYPDVGTADTAEAATVESGTDGAAEGGAEAGAEAGLDASIDAAPDAASTPDAADAATDGVADSAIDAVAEAATDGGACVTSPTTSYCSSVPALAAPPVIDGVLDCGPTLVAMTPQGWNGPGTLPAGNSASIAVAWRPNGLYVFVQVVTPVVIPADAGSPPFYGSGVEVYADSDVPPSSTYDNPGTIQLVAAAPSGSTPAVIGEGYRDAVDAGPWSPAEFATYPTSTGFVLEAFVVAGNLGLSTWTLASGSELAFDIAVNVSYPTSSTMSAQGHREGQYFFNVGTSPVGAPYADPRSFCAPTLQ